MMIDDFFIIFRANVAEEELSERAVVAAADDEDSENSRTSLTRPKVPFPIVAKTSKSDSLNFRPWRRTGATDSVSSSVFRLNTEGGEQNGG